MEAELRKAPASFRMSMLSRVRNYKRDVEQLTADVVWYSVLVILHWTNIHPCPQKTPRPLSMFKNLQLCTVKI